jgi:hypothetical protein
MPIRRPIVSIGETLLKPCRPHDRALVTLDLIGKAFDDRPSLMPYLGIDPVWDGLRKSPRFQEYLVRLGLAKAE